MDFASIITISILCIVLFSLVFIRVPVDVVMVGAMTLLLLTGVLTINDALTGFSNPGVITVGVLYVVVTGLKETGGIGWLVHRVLGRASNEKNAILRLMLPISGMSSFLNNTPVVAMMIPAVKEWSKKIGVNPSRLMIPLSYASILGGTCTLIGTSTNLIVNGLYIQETGTEGLGLFTISAIGLPCAIAGISFMVLWGHKLLPNREGFLSEVTDDHRQYTVSMQVPKHSQLIGKTIQEAGLRNLPGVYLFEISRKNEIKQAVSPSEIIQSEDILVFVGLVDSVVDLLAMRGLLPATDQLEKLTDPQHLHCFLEAVVSENCPVAGQTIKEGGFRNKYNAVVLAVARNGERINQKVGDIVLRQGDTLLLQASDDFHVRQKDSQDFYLTSKLDGSSPVRHKKALAAVSILAAMIALAGTNLLSMLEAALLASGLMVFFRCCSTNSARKNVDWSVLIVIAAAFSLGKALDKTGVAEVIARGLLDMAGQNPWISLLIVYAITVFFTETITNNAAVVLTFPIAVATSNQLDCNLMPFIIAVMVAGSASFSSPLGYQTNLMVMGPGGYHFIDYLKTGVFMNFLIGIVAISLIPFIWGF